MSKEINSKFPRKIQVEGGVIIVRNEEELKKVVLNSLYGECEDDKINIFKTLRVIDYIRKVMASGIGTDEELQELYSACETLVHLTDILESDLKYYDRHKRYDE